MNNLSDLALYDLPVDDGIRYSDGLDDEGYRQLLRESLATLSEVEYYSDDEILGVFDEEYIFDLYEDELPQIPVGYFAENYNLKGHSNGRWLRILSREDRTALAVIGYKHVLHNCPDFHIQGGLARVATAKRDPATGRFCKNETAPEGCDVAL